MMRQINWISPVAIFPKHDEQIRLCAVGDISLDLNGAKYFCNSDMSQACHQLELTPSSRKITTFATHAGLCQCKRLNYGTNSAAERFQNTLQQLLHGIDRVRNIADDIITLGPNYEEHNKALEKCLLRLETHGSTLNMGKCKFVKQNLEFFGMIFHFFNNN